MGRVGVARSALRTTGFTLVETLLAVALLSFMIIMPLTIASRSISAVEEAKNKTTAIALARDAIELIRSIRDSNRMKGVSWLTGLTGADNGCSTTGCNVDRIAASSALMVTPISDIYMTYQSSTGLYSYSNASGWAASPFKRQVYFPWVSTGNREVMVVVSVTWGLSSWSGKRAVHLTEHLFNW